MRLRAGGPYCGEVPAQLVSFGLAAQVESVVIKGLPMTAESRLRKVRLFTIALDDIRSVSVGFWMLPDATGPQSIADRAVHFAFVVYFP